MESLPGSETETLGTAQRQDFKESLNVKSTAFLFF